MSKILIVDEDSLIRDLLEHALEVFEEYGIKLLTAENGMSAIEIIKKEKPVLVFLDVMVPKMNGFEICNVVKNELEMKNIYISCFQQTDMSLIDEKLIRLALIFILQSLLVLKRSLKRLVT